MNVIVANEQQNQLANLDVDIIKSISGSYEVSELVEMFKSFFYSKMILDVTAIKQYKDVRTYELLTKGLDPEKIIFFLPEGSQLCTPNFLGHLISLGIYNFTTNLNGIKYLLKKSNTLQDVEHIRKMAHTENSAETGGAVVSTSVSTKVNDGGISVVGFRNITEHAGATTFIYMLRKELALVYGQEHVMAVEIDRNDYQLFMEKNMVSVRGAEIQNFLAGLDGIDIVLVDLNDYPEDSFCGDVVYLVEPSTIKLNKLIRKNQDVFQSLMSSKVVLNMSLLLNNDVFDFESEAGIKVFYNMPPLDERKRNAVVNDFLIKLGLIHSNHQENGGNSGRIFGLFRR